MSTPNYKLADNHAAAIGHVRELYAKVVAEFHEKNKDLEMGSFKVKGLGPMTPGEPSLNASDRNDAVPKAFLYEQFHSKDSTYTRTAVDEKVDAKLDKNGGIATGTLKYATGQPIMTGAPEEIPSRGVVDSLLDGKKSTGTFDFKIQNSNTKTHVSCDGDRYISIRSNGNKLADVHEDEQNQGCTVATYGKRLNLVSNAPQTLYQTNSSALFNLKYLDDGNTTPGQARFGQVQLAPSGTTNLNPALTLQSGRVNGLGVGGSIFLDSSYGTAQVPLIIAPESLSNPSANTMTMLSNSAAVPGGVRTVFSKKAGYGAGVVVDQPNQFASKAYVDSAVSGVPTPDLTPYVQKAGDTMTGALILAGEPVNELEAASKQYVDGAIEDAIDALVIPDPDLSDYLTKTGDQTITGNISAPEPSLDPHLATKFYVDSAIAAIETGGGGGLADQSTLIESGTLAPYKLSLEDAKVNFSDTDQVIFQQLFTEPGRMVQRHTDRPQILQEHIITTNEPDTVTLARVVRDQNRQTKMNYPQF